MNHRLLRSVALALLGCVGYAAHGDEQEDAYSCKQDQAPPPVAEIAKELSRRLSSDEFAFVAYAEGYHVHAYDLVARRMAWNRAGDAKSSLDLQAVLAARLINVQLSAGLDSEVVAFYHSLDPSLRGRLLHGKGLCVTNDEPYLNLAFHPRVTTADIALALATTGARTEASELLSGIDEMPAENDKDEWDCDLGAAARYLPECTSTLLREGGEFDAFQWRFGDASKKRDAPCIDMTSARSYHRLAERRFEAAHLPDAWRSGIESSDELGVTDSNEDKLQNSLKALPTMLASITTWRAKLALADVKDKRLIQRLQTQESNGPWHAEIKAVPSQADRKLAGSIEQRWKTAPYNPFKVEAATRSDSVAAHDSSCAKGSLRCSIDHEATWSLVLSSALDPSGEVPAGGYWLRREAANSKSQEFYLGLREHLPYALRGDVGTPLITDGRISLDMSYAKLKPETITFPPLGIEFEKDGKEVVLSAALADVQRDSDGDGLSDLAEERLLLDPQSPDTDADGIGDAEDPLPNVARRAATTTDAAMAAGLAAIYSEPDRAISFGVAQSGNFVRRNETLTRTLFVSIDPDALAGIDSDVRIVVVPKSLAQSATNMRPGFEAFYPADLLLTIAPDGRTGTLVWSKGWTGGTVALFWNGTRWQAGTLDGWVT